MNSKPKLYIACILVAFLLLHKFIGSAFENSETETNRTALVPT